MSCLPWKLSLKSVLACQLLFGVSSVLYAFNILIPHLLWKPCNTCDSVKVCFAGYLPCSVIEDRPIPWHQEISNPIEESTRNQCWEGHEGTEAHQSYDLYLSLDGLGNFLGRPKVLKDGGADRSITLKGTLKKRSVNQDLVFLCLCGKCFTDWTLPAALAFW